MNTLPLFYKNVIPLSKDQHSNYSVEPVKNYSFTRNTNSLYIAAIEFLKASKEYPIVFAESKDDTLFPVVILGLKNNQNLYIDKKGKWLANYIPAYIRRYPFILATSNEDGENFAVCIDKKFSGFNNKNKGQPLFDIKGGESDILKHSVNFLKEYQSHIQLTALFTSNIKALNILEPMQANIKLNDGEKLALSGFMGINREKLKSLPADKLGELAISDHLELIYAHLNSLDNIDILFKRMN